MADNTTASVSELVTQLSEHTSRLVRDEMRLARAELRETGKHAGKGLGLFSGAGLFAFFGVATLVTAAVLALSLVLPGWAAALIVTAVLFLVAGAAALAGKKEVQEAQPIPEHTVDNVRRDVQEIKSSGKRSN
ncbi:phage holin family protein [Microlunatus panaciterrae]|uniref:Membrane protein YqjE n=1 Tax=Microlunatus panaciterrae TaxID=400768 RepID=A0ABS2RF78_9ACTN|nr:phage holin family protein [Microlunatus panaciterrae]MBM7797650.1 putative membrane protein YqjE [Microlunatus panaciterrae]